MGYSTVDQVTTAVQEYNNDVRWARYDQASEKVPKERREHFVEQRTALEDDWQLVDFEVVNIVIDKKKDTAAVRVEYSWALKSRGIVEKTTTKQQWEKKDSAWMMEKETRVKGAPLVLFDEPTKEAAKTPRLQ